MKKFIADGKVAVLYSPGYGAGWYTWNSDFPQCVFQPEIVELILQGKREEAEKMAEELYGSGFYTGGASDLEVKWVEEGTQFEISEYDGNESVAIIGPQTGFIA